MSKTFINTAFISNEAKIAKNISSVCSTNQLFPLNLVENNVLSKHSLKESLSQHFSLLFDSADKDEEQYICIRFFKDNKKGSNEFYTIKEIFSSEGVDKIVELVYTENSNGYNACILPCTTSQSKATKSYIKGSQVLIIDIDDGNTEEKLKELTARFGEPTAIIKSGGITHGGFNKLHVYYKFNEFLKGDNFDELMELRKNIAKVIGADTHFKLSTQVIRLIGTINQGYDNKPICKIERYSSDITYDFKEFYTNAIKHLPINDETQCNNFDIKLGDLSLTTPEPLELTDGKVLDYLRALGQEPFEKGNYDLWLKCIFAINHQYRANKRGYEIALDWCLTDKTGRSEENIRDGVEQHYKTAKPELPDKKVITFRSIIEIVNENKFIEEEIKKNPEFGKLVKKFSDNHLYDEQYILTEKYLFIKVTKIKKNIPYSYLLTISNNIEVLGGGNGSNGVSYRLIKFIDTFGNKVEKLLAIGLRGEELKTHLTNLNLNFNLKHFSVLQNYLLNSKESANKVNILHKVGWDKDNTCYSLAFEKGVKPFLVNKEEKNKKYFLEFGVNSDEYLRVKGSFEKWYELTKLAFGNDMMIFVLGLPFASIWFTPLNIPSLVFHLFGQSRKGKSSLLSVASSVLGISIDKKDFNNWNTTSGGLENLCKPRNDSLLIIDELHEARDTTLIDAPYKLVNGMGANRMAYNQTTSNNKKITTWSVLTLSSGEKSYPDELVDRKRQDQLKGGMGNRFLDIPAVTEKFGVFSNVHSFEEQYKDQDESEAKAGADFHKHIIGIAKKNKGHAMLKYLKYVFEIKNFDDVLIEIEILYKEWIDKYFNTHKKINSRNHAQEHSIALNFAVTAAAMVTACNAEVLPYKKEYVFDVYGRLYNKYLQNKGDVELSAEERLIKKQFKDFIFSNIHSCFYNEAVVENKYYPKDGFYGIRKGNDYYLLKDRLQKIIPNIDSKLLISGIKTLGFVKPSSKGDYSHNVHYPLMGRSANFYLLDLDAIGVTNPEGDDDPSGGGTDEPEDTTIKDVDVSNNTDLVKSNVLVLKPEISSVKEVKQAATATITKSTLFLDTECYPNYFLIMLKDNEGNTHSFEVTRDVKLDVNRIRGLIANNLTVGFNSKTYDMPMIEAALRGWNNAMLKNLSDRIINEGAYKVLCEYNLWMNKSYNHIDIINVAIGKASLKMYGARINTPFLQDLPYDPSMMLSYDQMKVVREYCANDIGITKDLYDYLKNEIDLRVSINKEYDVDVRSRSDAQIAEELIAKKINCNYTKGGKSQTYDFYYSPPDYIKYNSGELNDLLDKFKAVNFKGIAGDKILNNDVPSEIKINNTTYSLGIGGIHSTESKRAIVIKNDEYLIDIDVVSYYPSIILNNNYVPTHLPAEGFLNFYRQIYNERIEAKKKGDKVKSNVFKIILNGSFGKFGDQYSILFSPNLLIHTTITGQLSLLMLIERLEEYGFSVVSSNTDGITVHFKKADYDMFRKIIKAWENKTNFETEETRYKALYNQSVNSYIAIKEDNTLKCKGSFVESNLAHNPTIKVCRDAVINYLVEGKPIKEAILNYGTAPENFLMVKKVTTGAYWQNKYLGKVARWYWSTEGEPIYSKQENTELKKDGTPKTNPKVADSDDAYPIMDLNDELVNINYEKYIQYTYKLLETLGVVITT